MADCMQFLSETKPSERISNFCTVRFFKTEYEQNFGFPHIPTVRCKRLSAVSVNVFSTTTHMNNYHITKQKHSRECKLRQGVM